MDQAEIYAFVARERYAVLSSVSLDGLPQSALVGIAVTAKLDVIFDTMRSSRKYANLTSCPECSLVVGLGGLSEQRTVQIDGIAEQPIGESLKGYLDVYLDSWPDGADRLKWPGIAHFAIHPRWIRYSVFGQNPAFIHEFRMAK